MTAIAGSIALVTGANRGIGRAFVDELLLAGATKVYAGARDPNWAAIDDDNVEVVQLDVTDPPSVAAAGITTRMFADSHRGSTSRHRGANVSRREMPRRLTRLYGAPSVRR